jgi:hypothetical protein
MRKESLLLTVIMIGMLALAIVIGVFFYSRGINSNSSSTPTPTPTPKTGNVTVSGLVIVHGLTIPPTEVAFISVENQEIYKAPINQTNQSYIISLPINQTYGIEGDWNGRTFNATGIPMGAITMQLYGGGYILSLINVTSSSITQNLQVGMQPSSIPTSTPTATPNSRLTVTYSELSRNQTMIVIQFKLDPNSYIFQENASSFNLIADGKKISSSLNDVVIIGTQYSTLYFPITNYNGIDYTMSSNALPIDTIWVRQ